MGDLEGKCAECKSDPKKKQVAWPGETDNPEPHASSVPPVADEDNSRLKADCDKCMKQGQMQWCAFCIHFRPDEKSNYYFERKEV